MNMSLVWLHDDDLCPTSPALLAATDPAPVVIFDPALIAARGYGLKRLMFIAECALAIPAPIYQGETVSTLAAQAPAYRQIITTATICPHSQAVLARLRAVLPDGFPLTIIDPPPFVDLRPGGDLKRFSRYWKRAAPLAFDGQPPPNRRIAP
jgi:deoxyribodipyrimidine photo-lyase